MKPVEPTTDQEWLIIQQAIKDRIDLRDPCAKRVFTEWVEKGRKKCETASIGETIHVFGADVAEAAIRFMVADLEEDVALRRADLAKEKCRLAGAALRASLLESDGIAVEGDDETHIVPELLRIVRVDRSAKNALLRQFLAASRQMAAGEAGEQPVTFPKALGADIDRFSRDLREFLEANGAIGREAVLRVCDNVDTAAEFADSDEAPAPLRFLAGVQLTLSKACLREPRNNGFGFARR